MFGFKSQLNVIYLSVGSRLIPVLKVFQIPSLDSDFIKVIGGGLAILQGGKFVAKYIAPCET